MTRKIIQISTCATTRTLQGTTQEYYQYITALCDDGTLWRKINNGNWSRVRDIPQDAPEEQPQAVN